MISISAVIITYNEEANIARCLQSVQSFADEILVVDSLSKDNTVAIAKQYGARIIDQKFLGYVEQKNFATEQAANEWVFSIDADEAVSPELLQSILKVKQQPEYDVYRVNRLTSYCGKWIKHSGWYPDAKIRLYKRSKGMWKGENPHDKWETHNAQERVGKLRGDLLHYSFYSITDHSSQIEKFSEIGAKAAVARGKNYSLLQLWFVPKWVFFTQYILRMGFLDGYYGYMVCKLSGYASLLKYAKTREYNKQKTKSSK